MNSFIEMMTNTFPSTSSHVNANVQHFIQNQWPIIMSYIHVAMNNMNTFWINFQNHPNRLVVLYPITLIAIAFIFWMTDNRIERSHIHDNFDDNIMVRKRRRYTTSNNRNRRYEHPMIRRSQSGTMFYMIA